MKNAKNIITISCFVIFIFGFAIANILKSDREFSDMENRTLQKKPEFSWEKFSKGEYTDDLEKYFADQIALKDEFVTVKTETDKLLGKSYQNGVYFGKDGYYLQDYQEDRNRIDQNIKSVNDFAEAVKGKAEISFMLVPNSVSVNADKLPSFNKSGDQTKTIKYVRNSLSKDINFYCPYDDLKGAKGQLYYRTDHHWTSQGAQVGFNGLMKSMGESVPSVKYKTETLDGFKGTLYSKAPIFNVKSDSVSLYTDPDNKIKVSYVGTSGDNTELAGQNTVVRDSLFAQEFKSSKDKYKTFLGGNFDLLEIESNNAQSDEQVLILKDSYANTAMQFFAEKYKHISVIDMRYYHMQEEYTVSEYIEKHNITKVIMLYNVDFFNTDVNFTWLG